MKYITKDRICSTLTAIAVSAVLFLSPWQWLTTATVWTLWIGMAGLLFVFGQGIMVLFENSKRTVAYVSNVYYNSRYVKRKDLLGEILDQVPPGVTVGVLLWNSYILAGSMAFLLWILANVVVELSVKLFKSLGEENQRKLIKEMKKVR